MMKKTILRSRERRYSELNQMDSFEERFKYLSLKGDVGSDTFGFDRYLNQKLYKSKEWKDVRNRIIVRDNACDLGIADREINGNIYIHHMNPIGIEDIKQVSDYLFNEDFLICTSLETHNAVHYGDEGYLKRNRIATRVPNDTCPWKK